MDHPRGDLLSGAAFTCEKHRHILIGSQLQQRFADLFHRRRRAEQQVRLVGHHHFGLILQLYRLKGARHHIHRRVERKWLIEIIIGSLPDRFDHEARIAEGRHHHHAAARRDLEDHRQHIEAVTVGKALVKEYQRRDLGVERLLQLAYRGNTLCAITLFLKGFFQTVGKIDLVVNYPDAHNLFLRAVISDKF